MHDKKQQQAMVKSQAQLDQAWASIEPILPQIAEIGDRGFGPHTTADDLMVARMCTQMVCWELSLRVLNRNFYLRAVVYPQKREDGEVLVRVTTKDGHAKYFVPYSAISYENEEDETAESYPGYVSVKSYKLPGVYSVAVLPTSTKDILIVPDSEIKSE